MRAVGRASVTYPVQVRCSLMDDEARTQTLIQRNRALLAQAADACVAAREAVATAEHALHMVRLNRVDRERRTAVGRQSHPARRR